MKHKDQLGLTLGEVDELWIDDDFTALEHAGIEVGEDRGAVDGRLYDAQVIVSWPELVTTPQYNGDCTIHFDDPHVKFDGNYNVWIEESA